MKIISLNTWGGQAGKEGLLDFLKNHDDADVFCLQEIWNGGQHLEGVAVGAGKIIEKQIYELLKNVTESLPNHKGFFRSQVTEDYYGLSLFIKKDIPVIEEGEVFVHKFKEFMPEDDLGKHARNIQYINMRLDDKPLTIINFYGLWNGQGKTDSEDRILQSKNIVEFCGTIVNEFILCGDFNLRPDTKSIKIFEDFGLRNLIKEYGITSTRTSHYDKDEKFADYVFVTKGIKIRKFEVLPDEVSDHAPLYVEFDL